MNELNASPTNQISSVFIDYRFTKTGDYASIDACKYITRIDDDADRRLRV